MALIECPECGREVSSSANDCPACAYPLRSGGAVAPTRTTPGEKWRARAKLGVQIAARLIVGVSLIGASRGPLDTAAVAATIGGVLIAASAIPVWYRARLAGAGGSGAARLDQGVGERVVSVEEQQRELAELTQMQADRFADLEERVDFAERLLTKRRDQP